MCLRAQARKVSRQSENCPSGANFWEGVMNFMRLFNNLERVEQFKTRYQKHYANDEDELNRYGFFKKSKTRVTKHDDQSRTSSWKSEFGSLWSWLLVVWSLLIVLDLRTRPWWLESLFFLQRERETRLPHEACHCSSRGTQFAREFYRREMSLTECGHHGNFPLCEPIQEVQDCMSKNVSYRVKVHKFPIENAYSCLFVHREKGWFLAVHVDDIKLAGKKHNIDPMWKLLNKEVDLGEPTYFLDHVCLGCTQRQCEISKDIVDNYRTMFESRISAGDTEKLPFPQHLRISSWSCDMEGHAKKCVEGCCELAYRTTQQLYKVSTPCIDDHRFKEEMKSVWELPQVSQIVLKWLYMARIGRPDNSVVSEQTCTLDNKMDQSLWQTLESIDILRSSHLARFTNASNFTEWSMIWIMLTVFPLKRPIFRIKKLCCMCLKTTKQWSRWS